MSLINPSAVGETFEKDFQDRLNACQTPEEIKTLFHDRELAAGLFKFDWSPDYRIPTEPQQQPQSFTKTITVNGVAHTISGDSTESLASAEVAFYRSAFAQPAAPAPQPTPARDANTGRFVEQERQADVSTMSAEEKAALQLQFQLGQIDAATYIERSGAIANYLEKQGVPLPVLQEAVQEKQEEKFAHNWSDATSTFIARHPEWPGTEANRQALGKFIIENNLIDGDPLAAMEAAYRHARENNLLVTNPIVAARAQEAEQAEKIANATTPEELRHLVGYRGQDSGFWGGR